MAKTTVVQLTDDIDGSEAVEALSFALRGVEYEIDLNAKNVAALEKALDKYVAAGRRLKATRRPRPTNRRGAPAETTPDVPAIREWARHNGWTVSDRGRIAGNIRAAYDEAVG